MFKQKVKAAYFLVLIFLTACGLFKSKSPCESLIDSKTMVSIVSEAFLLEAYVSSHTSAASIYDSIPYYYSGIFTKYDTDAAGFEQALNCYLLDRDMMNKLVDDVLSNLSIAQSRAQEKKDAPSSEEAPVIPE